MSGILLGVNTYIRFDEVTAQSLVASFLGHSVQYIHTYFISNTAVQNSTYNAVLGGRQGYHGAYSRPQKEKKDKHKINRSNNTTVRL